MIKISLTFVCTSELRTLVRCRFNNTEPKNLSRGQGILGLGASLFSAALLLPGVRILSNESCDSGVGGTMYPDLCPVSILLIPTNDEPMRLKCVKTNKTVKSHYQPTRLQYL